MSEDVESKEESENVEKSGSQEESDAMPDTPGSIRTLNDVSMVLVSDPRCCASSLRKARKFIEQWMCNAWPASSTPIDFGIAVRTASPR
jgi:hypothetical protein